MKSSKTAAENPEGASGGLLGRVGIIGRFKPLHNGAALILDYACQQSQELIIGIGSANKYDLRNPFTAEETESMIHTYLHMHNNMHNNYHIVFIPDFGHIPQYRDGSKWKEYVITTFGTLDHFISGNPYVKELLGDTYDIIHPTSIIPPDKQLYLNATMVRKTIAEYGRWKDLIPDVVSTYLQDHQLIDRFRKEFGLKTIAAYTDLDHIIAESYDDERQKIIEPQIIESYIAQNT